MVHTGSKLWPKSITEDMVEKQISDDRTINTFPNLPMNIYESFTDTVRRVPSKTALVDDQGREYTYYDLFDKVQKFSAWLYSDVRIQPGDHAALMLFNSVEFCVTFLSLNRIGAVVVPLPTKYKKEEVHSLIEKSDVNVIISDEKFESYFDVYKEDTPVCIVPDGEKGYALDSFLSKYPADMKGIDEKVKEDDTALLMFTSGTTSQSKGVMIRNYNIMHAIVAYQRVLGIKQEDRTVIPIPIYLVTGLVAVFGLMMHVGGTVYLNKFFNAERVLQDIVKYDITFFHASPTVFTLLLGQKQMFPELPSLRMFACGSSNMPPGKIRMLKSWIPQCEFRTIYGLTETTSPGTVFPMDANESAYIGSSGIPIPGIEVKIVDDNGNEIPDGEEGRVLIRGTNITESYYKMDSPALQNGWLDTGDIGYVNGDSYLYIVDRKKDMINRGGEKICSFDVENEISFIDGVEDVAVVGIPDQLYGEVPVAMVKVRDGSGISEEYIRTVLKGRIAGYKIPAEIQIVDEIPLTKNLKTDKKRIRQIFIERKGAIT